jgi:hypothetical protein
VEPLDTDGRVDEIGRMIGGAALTDRVRASARELLSASESVGNKAQPLRKDKAKAKGEKRKRN